MPGSPLGLITEGVQVLAGVLLPAATVFLLMLCNDKAVLGPWVNAAKTNAFTGRDHGADHAVGRADGLGDLPGDHGTQIVVIMAAARPSRWRRAAGWARGGRAAGARAAVLRGGHSTGRRPTGCRGGCRRSSNSEPKITGARRVGLIGLRGYLAIAMIMVVVKVVLTAVATEVPCPGEGGGAEARAPRRGAGHRTCRDRARAVLRMLLADLGAEVIQVDRPGGSRSTAPRDSDVTNRGKRRVVVDLKHPRGAEVVLRFADASDALIEGYRPGVRGAAWRRARDCLAREPGLVYGRMTGWGQDGPLTASAGHDIAYIAVTGALHAIGRAEGPPQVPVDYLGDFGGGSMFLALGLRGPALRPGSGRGRVVDAAIVDGAPVLRRWATACSRTAPGPTRAASTCWTPVRRSTTSTRRLTAGHGGRRARAPVLRGLPRSCSSRWPAGRPAPPSTTGRAGPEQRSRFAARFAERSQGEWTKAFGATDACVAPVRSMTEAPADPHLAARGSYVTCDGVVPPAPARRFPGDGTADAPIGALPPGPVSHTGAHTREVLTALGFGDVDELLTDGAVWQA